MVVIIVEEESMGTVVVVVVVRMGRSKSFMNEGHVSHSESTMWTGVLVEMARNAQRKVDPGPQIS